MKIPLISASRESGAHDAKPSLVAGVEDGRGRRDDASFLRALRGAVSALLAQLSTGLTRTTAFIAVNILASPRLGGLVNVII